MMGLGAYEAYVPVKVTFCPTAVAAATSAASFFAAAFWAEVLPSSTGAMLNVKSAVFDCTASSETATLRTVGEDSITSASGNCDDLPFTVSQTLAASSGLPLARMNSLSLTANVDRSGVVAITFATMSAGDGAGLILKSAGGFRLAFAAATTAS